ncbi:hypothetical protein UlMin_009273 [Ulmus minor]
MMFLRRGITLASKVKPHFLSTMGCSFCSKALNKEGEVASQSDSLHLSPLFPDSKPHLGCYNIELVDNDAWQVSSGLAQAWRDMDGAAVGTSSLPEEVVGESVDNCSLPGEEEADFDDIDNMRIRGSLFYKLDRDSKEFEEYSFEFHRRKKTDDPKESKKKKNDPKEGKKDNSRSERLPKVTNNKCGWMTPPDEMESDFVGKKKMRTPTFNQLTGPYHEPFCLDIFISKASVRACIVHRVTSNVVAVAHSISKDMKFDLASTRNSAACAAVGAVLAQRALADDIHDVVYTPRKGDRLEGKLQLVLNSIIDNGINVKVKIKQRFNKSVPFSFARHQA